MSAGLFARFTIRLTVNAPPPVSSPETLVIAYWDGRAWTEIATTVRPLADGAFELTGSADRMAIYAVLHAPVRGEYDRPRPATGANVAVWLGGTIERAIARSSRTVALVVYRGGRPVTYRVGGDPAANAAFLRLFPQDVISMGTIVLVVRAEG